MNIDLAAILVILTAVTGAVWLYDLVVLAPQRKKILDKLPENVTEQERENAVQLNFAVDLARSLFPVFLIVLLLRSFLVEPFRIPSNSMMPTLLTGDFILVNKYTYGIRLPVLNTKVIEIGTPQRGDVVVFRYPEDPSLPFIKRVVGLPGDEVMYHNVTKTLYINGEAVSQQPIGTYQGFGPGSNMTGATDLIEDLDGVAHHILILPHPFDPRKTLKQWAMKVPEGEYVVFGDNRDNSRDSRFWGTVPEENLVGRAFFIWMNASFSGGINIDWRRIGRRIQ